MEDIRALGEANRKEYLPSMQEVDLSDNKALSGQLTLLFTHTWPVLQKLHLRDCNLTVEDIRALVEANRKEYLPSLQEVQGLSGNKNVSGQVAVLLSSGWQSLRKLNLEWCYLPVEDIRALVEANRKGYLPALQHLYLSGNKALSGQLTLLFTHIWPVLQQLDLQHSNLTVEDTRALGEANRNGYLPSIKEVNLQWNTGQLALLFTHTWQVLEKLDLSYCGLTSAAGDALLDACRQGHLPQLKKLDISSSSLSYYTNNIPSDKIAKLKEHIEEVKSEIY